MNTTEHLMVCGSEEAGEVAVAAMAVAKALSKMLRFGPEDINPERLMSTTDVLVAELNDLEAVVEMLLASGMSLPGLHDRQAIEAKKRKVQKFMVHAELRGALVADAKLGA